MRRGELFALPGTNGAGKTSAMEVLEGLAPPARGAVRVLGCDPCRERALVRRRMGIMLQEGGFAPDLTVAETGRMWAGTLRAPRPVAEALGLVSLGHRAGVAVRSLSGGERRRLDLAMAILGRPEVLFLDEPATGLDPESRRRTWLLVRELLGAGTTVVLTTHYLEEAEELADRLAIMHQGRIVRTGTPAQVAASQPARIRFELPGDSREPVPDIAGTRASVTGRTVLLQTADLQPTLTALLGWANSRDLVLGALDARPASLAEALPRGGCLSRQSSRRRQRKGRGGMSAGTVTASSPGQSSHRVAALARAEGILLWRNRLALLNAVILPAAVPAGDAARATAMGRGGAAADAGGGTDAARSDGSRRRRSPPRAGRDLRRGRHPGARAHRLDRGGRVGGTTLVPLGTTALSKRDRLEG